MNFQVGDVIRHKQAKKIEWKVEYVFSSGALGVTRTDRKGKVKEKVVEKLEHWKRIGRK